MKKIFIGSDHGGYELKQKVIQHLKSQGYPIEDVGCNHEESCDHPVYAKTVAEKVVNTDNAMGILLCGSGLGMSIAANKVKGAVCILANSIELAKLGRKHNGAQILAMGGRTQFIDDPLSIVEMFLNTPVDMTERYQKRREMIDNLLS